MSKKFDPSVLSEFARHYGFHYNLIEPSDLIGALLGEMEKGLAGQSSSLPMIPSYISPAHSISPGKTVIALDAGGTNLRSARIKFDENCRPVILESRKVSMPGTNGSLGEKEFFDEIAAVTAPMIESSDEKPDGLGFCFSYPMEMTKDEDGILLAFSKEVEAPHVIGKAIGRGLRAALERRKVAVPGRIVLLNDTVAALLSGTLDSVRATGNGAYSHAEKEGPVIGFILGTGVNIAYPETCIPKIDFYSHENPQIVVCETGNFAHNYSGLLDKEFDRSTKNPGAYALEKTAAGAYLGPLAFHILRQANKDGLLDFKRADEFFSLPGLQTKDLNAFLHESIANPVGKFFAVDEKDAMESFIYLVSIITRRGALLSAAAVAAAVEKTGAGFDPLAPVRIAVEGSTYSMFKGMRQSLESYLDIMLNRTKQRAYIINTVEQASLFGAAVVALESAALESSSF